MRLRHPTPLTEDHNTMPIDKLHPAVSHVLAFFDYKHLPAQLQTVSKAFHDLAHQVAARSSSPETTVALRKLLEAKDAAVRAAL